MKIEKNFRKDFDNRIKQLCEDFCDQADERKFFLENISNCTTGTYRGGLCETALKVSKRTR